MPRSSEWIIYFMILFHTLCVLKIWLALKTVTPEKYRKFSIMYNQMKRTVMKII